MRSQWLKLEKGEFNRKKGGLPMRMVRMVVWRLLRGEGMSFLEGVTIPADPRLSGPADPPQPLHRVHPRGE